GTVPLQFLFQDPPSVVISEIDNQSQTVEFQNTANVPLDLSNWDFRITDSSAVLVHIHFPTPFVVAPLGTALQAAAVITNPPTQVLYSDTPARPWVSALLELRDPSGNLIDQ